jgi:hypothetical protein
MINMTITGVMVVALPTITLLLAVVLDVIVSAMTTACQLETNSQVHYLQAEEHRSRLQSINVDSLAKPRE